MTTNDYLIEMTFPPFAVPLTPRDGLNFTERLVLPTLEACQKLQDEGRILAGGPALATAGFSFIIRTQTADELETVLGGLPLWNRAQTRVVPLGSFATRAATVRSRRIAMRKAAVSETPAAAVR